jgi:predicted lipid-binding transport protein (Tim44 family)
VRHLALAVWVSAQGIAALAAGNATAQELFTYPARGQSQDQQERDRYECHRWAVQQTGFDPGNPTAAAAAPAPPAPAAEPQRGGLVRGAAGGAALGAIGGAIGGDAGKGAAIGAATGGAIGVVRRHRQQAEQQHAYQQQQSAQGYAAGAQRASYNRALGACLQGRGYTVN